MYNTPQDNIFSIKDSGIHKEKLVINMEVGLREHESKTFSELVDSANEMASEVSEVYTALGLQAGMKIMQELLKGMNK